MAEAAGAASVNRNVANITVDEEVVPTYSDYDSEQDCDYDPEVEVLEEDAAIHLQAEEWVGDLERDDVMSLTLLFYDLLVTSIGINLTDDT